MMLTNNSSDLMASMKFLRDMNQNVFVVCDVAGLGDCAVIALLGNPSFKVPLTSVQELRRAVVSFAQGVAAEDCSRVYSILKSKTATVFNLYLEQVLQPGFWVGTEFFVWATMLYGIEIKVHFFTSHKQISEQSSLNFLRTYLPDSPFNRVSFPEAVNVFFHQYKRMTDCVYSRYNHFAMLIPHPFAVDEALLINTIVSAEHEGATHWWQKQQGDAAGDTNPKSKAKVQTDTHKPEGKPGKRRKAMTKEEWKKKQTLITANYIERMSSNMNQAAVLKEKFELARQRALAIAKEHSIDVENIDLPVSLQPHHITDVSKDVSVALPRSLTGKNISRTWIQRAYIIFIYLHPQMGNKDVDYTCQLTGVKANTLLGWVRKSKMIECWISIVAAIRANEVLRVLPPRIQECFEDIKGESAVCVRRYKTKIKKGSQLKIVFTGINVSFLFCFDVSCLVVH